MYMLTGLSEMVASKNYHLLLLHLALLLLLSLHTIAQECRLEDYLICPGIPEQDVGAKIELRVGIILQTSTLPPTPEASANETQSLSNDRVNRNDRGVEYFLSSSLSQQVATQMERINSDPNILADHHLCALFAFYLTDCPGVSSADGHILFARSSVFVAVNVLYDKDLHAEHSHIMANFYPVLSIDTNEHYSTDIASQGVDAFTQKLAAIGSEDNCPHTYDTIMEMIIRNMEMLVSVSAFTTSMGWERIGILLDCQLSNGEFLEQWSISNASLSFSCYEEGNFLGSFENFDSREIFIYAFLGKIESYFQFLILAHKYGVIGRR